MVIKKKIIALLFICCTFSLPVLSFPSIKVIPDQPSIWGGNSESFLFETNKIKVGQYFSTVVKYFGFKLNAFNPNLAFSKNEAKVSDQTKALQIENLYLKDREEKYKGLVYALLSCLILTVAVTYLVAKRQQRNYLKQKSSLASEKNQINSEKQEIESELKEAAAQLYAFTLSIWEKNKLIASYTDELKKNSGLSELYYQQDHANIMQQLIQATLLTDEQWDSFRHLFDKVYPGYLFRLQEQLPGLSPAESRYLLLRKLNLSNKEMAAMLGVGPDSVRQYRSRLRKKYNFTEEEKLDELVATI